MIAPYRAQHEEAGTLRQARRTAARLTLGEPAETAPTMPAWQAWLAAGWMLLVLGCYVLCVLDWMPKRILHP